MRKKNYFILQVVLSLILIGIGVALEMLGQNIVAGVPHLLFIVPGVVLLLEFVIDFYHAKKWYIYPLIYMALIAVMDIIIVSAFKIELTGNGYGILVGVFLLGTMLAELFHLIFDNLAHPGKLFRF